MWDTVYSQTSMAFSAWYRNWKAYRSLGHRGVTWPLQAPLTEKDNFFWGESDVITSCYQRRPLKDSDAPRIFQESISKVMHGWWLLCHSNTLLFLFDIEEKKDENFFLHFSWLRSYFCTLKNNNKKGSSSDLVTSSRIRDNEPWPAEQRMT